MFLPTNSYIYNIFLYSPVAPNVNYDMSNKPY